MNTPATLSILLGLALLTACPSSRPSDRNDDAADETPGDGDPAATTGVADPGTPAAVGDGDGDPAATCEPERQALADCQAAK